jgi:chromosome partitioning protein
MKVVAIASQKGGAGKTTLALNLAIAAELSGLAAIVVDLDPQASAAGWSDLRESDSPAIVAAPVARLEHALRAAEAGGADLAILDTPPHAEGAALLAVKAADLIAIPCRPALLDLRAIGATAALAQIAGKPAFVVLNAAPPGAPRLIEEAQKGAAVHGLAVAPVVVTQRAAFGHALTAGQGVQEFEPSGRAAVEIERLYSWLTEAIGLKGKSDGKRKRTR